MFCRYGSTPIIFMPLRQDHHDQGAEHRALDAAQPAGQRRTADHHGGDRVEFEPIPSCAVAAMDPRLQQTGHAAEQAEQHVHADLHAVHRMPVRTRHALAAADRAHLAAENGGD